MGLEDDIGKLARIPAFAVIEPEALRLIAFSAETRILRADVLFRRDEISNDGFVVLAGSIAMDASGDGAITARIGGLLVARGNGIGFSRSKQVFVILPVMPIVPKEILRFPPNGRCWPSWRLR